MAKEKFSFKYFLDKGKRDYQSFVDDLSAICGKKNLPLKTLGRVQDNDIYLVTVNPKGKPTICFIAGIHGNEEAGPLGLLNWLSQGPKTDYRILVIPCANPHGFIRDVRRNSVRKDLNRRWCDEEPQAEAEILKKFFDREKISFLYSVHEDPLARKFYVYYSDKEGLPYCDKIVDMAKKYFDLNKSKRIRGAAAQNSAIPHNASIGSEQDCSLETYLFKKYKMPYLVNETPGTADLQTRINYITAVANYLSRSAV